MLGKVRVVILPQGQQVFVLNPAVNTYKYSECCHKSLKNLSIRDTHIRPSASKQVELS